MKTFCKSINTILLILAVIIGTFLLTGCSNTPDQASSKNIEIMDFSDTYKYSILIDPDTGVQYIRYRNGRQAGLTVRLDADGNVMTAPVEH